MLKDKFTHGKTGGPFEFAGKTWLNTPVLTIPCYWILGKKTNRFTNMETHVVFPYIYSSENKKAYPYCILFSIYINEMHTAS